MKESSFIDMLEAFSGKFEGFVWGPFLIALLVLSGLYLSFGTRFVQFRKLGTAFKLLFSKQENEEGDISPFQALMTSLSATIGTGNIAGVAGAIVAGGPGAVFWMWMTGSIGGALKFGEAVLAVKYRKTNELGEVSGGPMYYITYGMKERFGGNWQWLGFLFALFGVIASFGIGNMTQSNSIADALHKNLDISPQISGILFATLTALVIIGGIKHIAKVTEKIVPIMAIFYVVGALTLLFINRDQIGTAFFWIFDNAFSSKAVTGGLVGSVIRFGVARGLFSNEAGMGSAAIAHAAAKSNDPVRQGIVASLGSFIDTLIICTMTALVILTSGIIELDTVTGVMSLAPEFNQNDLDGAAFTTHAFGLGFSAARYVVTFGLMFFAFSTIIGWYYYGEKCLEYIGKNTAYRRYYQLLWVVVVWAGAVLPLKLVWSLSGAFNGLMALPNLIALIGLSGIIFKALRDYEPAKKS